MTAKTHVLTDAARNTWLDEFSLRPSGDVQLAGSHNWSISKTTLHGGVSQGVDVVELNNGSLSISILPTRGMGLWRGNYRGIELGWTSPVRRPVHPSYVNLAERSGLGWLTGFNELMCRCGLSWHGEPGIDVIQDNTGNRIETPLTLHGKIANRPAHRVEVAAHDEGQGMLRVKGVVDEAMLFGPYLELSTTIETEAGSNWLTIRDEITNRGGQPAEVEVLYHTNLGPPILEQGAQFEAPIRELAPSNNRAAEGIRSWQVCQGPTAGYVEQCYFMELEADDNGETVALLRNHAADVGFSIALNRNQLPYFTLWKNTQAEADGYVIGMEPGTTFPNLKTFERRQGRLQSLAPGESCVAQITLAIHDSALQVAEVEERIKSIRGGSVASIHESPVAKYSHSGR